jgi:hypothetical protein
VTVSFTGCFISGSPSSASTSLMSRTRFENSFARDASGALSRNRKSYSRNIAPHPAMVVTT